MSWIDEMELRELLVRFLETRHRERQSGEAAPKDPGPVWKVRALLGGGFAVLPAEAPPGAEADALLFDRRQAYLTAAVFTALGGPDGAAAPARSSAPSPAPSPTPSAGDPPNPALPDPAVASRLFRGLVAHPAAMELLLEAVGPDTLAEAEELARERFEARGEEPVH